MNKITRWFELSENTISRSWYLWTKWSQRSPVNNKRKPNEITISFTLREEKCLTTWAWVSSLVKTPAASKLDFVSKLWLWFSMSASKISSIKTSSKIYYIWYQFDLALKRFFLPEATWSIFINSYLEAVFVVFSCFSNLFWMKLEQ